MSGLTGGPHTDTVTRGDLAVPTPPVTPPVSRHSTQRVTEERKVGYTLRQVESETFGSVPPEVCPCLGTDSEVQTALGEVKWPVVG